MKEESQRSSSGSTGMLLWSLMSAGVFGVVLAAVVPMMMTTWTTKDRSSTTTAHIQLLIMIGGSLTVGVAVFLLYRRKDGDSGSFSSERTDISPSNQRTTLKNIWEAGRKTKQGSGSGSSSNKEDKMTSDKPFGSKYYYAHNNPNATGGYKDGLKTEDYRMNGPRLLSKNGLSVDDNDTAVSSDNNLAVEDIDLSTAESIATSKTIVLAPDDANNVRDITKYLWDDPGDSYGVATIRIEVLPDKRPGEYLEWKEAAVEEVTASLAGEGLVVKITTTTTTTSAGNDDDNKKTDKPLLYRLKIAKLYGDAADVKCIVKPKRLLIKIYKKKNSFLSSLNSKGSTNNLDAWPQPHRKI